MTKAEERANEKYPLMPEDDKAGLESLKYIGMECDSVYEFNSIRYSQQCYFIEGYQQAEKDLADTFIKKACFWLELNLSDRPKEDIKFWIEDFKNYMEGE